MIRRNTILSFAAATLFATAALVAGPLDPPAGPVTSTYKTLNEVEPRTAINATNTPGDADSLFKITQPGSYYLTGNITGVVGKHGVEIAASGVTLDLMGFSLQGVPGSLSGVAAVFPTQNVIVRNGTASAWGVDGIGLISVSAVVDSIISEANGQDGVDVGSNSVVRACVGRGNAFRGIIAGTGCSVTACTAIGNTMQGINVNSRSSVTGCAAEANTGDGISASFGTVIADCSSGSNTASGISIAQGGIVTRCFVSFNAGDGIVSAGDGTIVGNACDNNGNGSGISGAGILLTGTDNRVEGNNCTDSDFGIRVTAVGNFIIRNTCSGNTSNWDIAIGNSVGPIVVVGTNAAAITGTGPAPFTLGSTDPHANFSY